MDRYVLIALHDLELAEALEAQILAKLETGDLRINVTRVRNAVDARARLPKKYDLLITGAALPQDKESIPGTDAQVALDLLTDARGVSQDRPVSSILILPLALFSNELLRKTREIERCSVVLNTAQLETELVQECARLLAPAADGGPAAEKDHPIGKVKISIGPDLGLWTYSLQGIGLAWPERIGSLQVDPSAIRKLVRDSEELETDDADWEKRLQKVGEELANQLFARNQAFNEDFRELVGRVDGEQNIQIEFGVRPEVHSVILEALYEVRQNLFWMLHAPVYRRFAAAGRPPPPLSSGRRSTAPLNCLILAANAHGTVTVGAETFDLEPLQGVQTEAKSVWDLLDAKSAAFNIGRLWPEKPVEPGRPQPSQQWAELTWDHVKTISREVSWDIVHYAGHSWFDPKQQKSFLFFGAGPALKAVSVEEFGLALRRPRFVFLSSCQSSLAASSFDLVRNQIGAVLGFRHSIFDDKAVDFATTFYDLLFTTDKSLEYAFLNTRKLMHARHQSDKIWASPVLMM